MPSPEIQVPSGTAKPNVLFIICDDLNNAVSRMGRVPCSVTPNLSKLMAESVRFQNAQCNDPVCLPSRSSLFSGLYPHVTGHYTLWDSWRSTTAVATTGCYGRRDHGVPLLRNAVMMPKHFRDNGYGVYGVGKVLHEGVVNPEWWDEYGHGPDYGPFLWDAQRKCQRSRPDREWLCEGEPFSSYVKRYEGVDRFFLDGDRFRHHIEKAFGPLCDLFPGEENGVLGGGKPYRYAADDDRDLLPDERTAAWAVDILSRRHERPFFLGVGFMKPHTPLNAPSKYFDMFPPEELELPPLLDGDLDDCARALIEHRPYGFLTYGLLMKGGEALWREWLQAYLACIAFMDDQLGKVLSVLESSPYRENTVVVFTSDNGYHMGEKEYIFKDTLWEESCQVPLIIRAPGQAQENRECHTPVSLIDLYPTLVDLCGLPSEPNAGANGRELDGHSLRRLLHDPDIGNWGGHRVALSSVRGDTGIHHSVRSRTHRYTLCGNGEEELYNHDIDPHEWHNCATDPEYAEVKAQLRREMMTLLWS